MKPRNELSVLIIDDDVRAAQTILQGLNSVDPRIRLYSQIAHTTSEALRETSVPYDLVFLDLHMASGKQSVSEDPVLDGLRKENPAVHFVVYSNHHSPSRYETFLKDLTGADFIFKESRPTDLFSSGSLVALLKEIISSKEGASARPEASLLFPVRSTIKRVNDRLASMFQQDPNLLKKLDPFIFEEFVGQLFEADGYEIEPTPKRADGGKDLYVSKKDAFTSVRFLVECKRYTPPLKVDVSVVRQLYGVVQQENASGGIIVTTSYFTKPAKTFAEAVPYHLFLRDFDYLSNWFKRQS